MAVTHHLLPAVVNAYRWATLLGGCVLLSACNPDPAVTSNPVEVRAQQAAGSLLDLKFDRRYLDTIALGPPYSERAQREIAIQDQLDRLANYKRDRAILKEENRLYPSENKYSARGDSITEGKGDKLREFPNHTALLTDIYQKMDSLKVLENIPLTPYPSVESYEN